MACSAYNPFWEIFLVFYSATNPIVLIEFIDIKDISNPEASPNRPRFPSGIVSSITCESIGGAGSLRCAAVFHLAEVFGRTQGDEF
jgi:hypothetical protein